MPYQRSDCGIFFPIGELDFMTNVSAILVVALAMASGHAYLQYLVQSSMAPIYTVSFRPVFVTTMKVILNMMVQNHGYTT
jgi:hypothetical protein